MKAFFQRCISIADQNVILPIYMLSLPIFCQK